jgi:hypothetical protein
MHTCFLILQTSVPNTASLIHYPKVSTMKLLEAGYVSTKLVGVATIEFLGEIA